MNFRKPIMYLTLCLGIGIMSSCNNEQEDESTNEMAAPATTQASEASDLDKALNNGAANQPQANPAAPATQGTATQPNPQQMQPAPQPAPSNAKGMNPEHGKPGHRCDIPVGAPLNSPPGKMPAPQEMKTTQGTPPPQASATSVAPAKPKVVAKPANTASTDLATGGIEMPKKAAAQTTDPAFVGKPNPEHGKPGHRCDLAVGAILP